MQNKLKKLLSEGRKHLNNTLRIIGKNLALVGGKLKEVPPKKIIMVTYIAAMLIFLGVITLGVWPGVILPDKQIPMEKEEQKEKNLDDIDVEISVFEEKKEPHNFEVDKDQEVLQEKEKPSPKVEDYEHIQKDEKQDEKDLLEADDKGEDLEEEKPEKIATTAREVPEGMWPLKGEVITGHKEVYQVNSQYMVHKGINIRAPKDTEVLASWSGEIKEVKEGDGMGVTIIISHDGFKSKYGNLKNSLYDIGDSVSAGDEIGLVGDDAKLGAAEGSFLNFVVYSQQKYFDPIKLLE